MKKILKIIAFTLASILWLIFLIVHTIMCAQGFTQDPLTEMYRLLYILCDFSILCFCIVKSVCSIIDFVRSDEIKRHKEAKALKLRTQKQKRIEELQAELQNLRKDDTNSNP